MFISYRRTGSALGLTVATLAVTTLTLAVAAAAVIGVVVVAPIALLTRALMPTSTRHRRASTSPWPRETVEADVVTDPGSSDAGVSQSLPARRAL